MRKLVWIGIALSLIAAGCTPTATPAAKTDPGKTEPGKETPGTGTEPGKTDPAAGTGDGKTDLPGATPAKPENVPANVKTDAFRYLGLNQKASPKFELSGSPAGIQTGSIETTLVSIENGVPRYKQTWTGGLTYIGESELIARPDGVFSVSAAGKTFDPPQMELPASPAKDKTWSADQKMELQGATIESSQVRVLGIQTVKTKLGTFQALAVRGLVTGKRDGKALKVVMTAHYVKDKGPVRIEIQGPGPDGKPSVTLLQATKG
jgi:hypothetical protein